jgi:DedD protein
MSLKHRLVGAAVVIAALVIFVPMLVDGEKGEGQASIEMKLPPPPKYDFDQEPLPDPDEEFSFRPAERPEQAYVPPLPVPAEPVASPAEPAAQEPKAIVPPKRPALAVPAAKPAIAKPAKVASAPPVRTEPPKLPGLKGWAVQVGSFGESSNAAALADRLKSQGFDAFVQPAGSTGGKAVHRVKVGPEPQRAQAEALRSRLAQQNIQGIVVSHP